MFNLSFIGDLTVDIYKDLNQIKLGGASLNQAIWTKRLGHNPTVLAAIGEDDFGKKYLDFLKKENINALIKQIKGKTSQIEIFLDENGERHWGKWEVGVMEDYHLGKEELVFLKTQDAVCLPIYFPTKHLLAEVSSAKFPISNFQFPINHQNSNGQFSKIPRPTTIVQRPLLVADFDDLSQFQKKIAFLEEHLPFLDLVFLGLDKENDKNLIQQLKNLAKEFQKTIVITLNAQGSVCFANDRKYQQTAQQIKAVDTTGGGDAFLVGFVIEYLNTKNITTALQKGTELATMAITRMGAY